MSGSVQRLTARLRATHRSSAVAAVAVATAACCRLLGGGESTRNDDARDGKFVRCEANHGVGHAAYEDGAKNEQKERLQLQPSASLTPGKLASSPQNHNHFNPRTHRIRGKENVPKRNILECDYVIVGHGKAGQSAVRTIKRLDPTAAVVIIDPNNIQQSTIQHASGLKKQRLFNNGAPHAIHHLPKRASYIDHSRKMIHVHPIASSASSTAPKGSSVRNTIAAVHYRKSALIATGSRGAPPPESCIRKDARGRILELRSTGLPRTGIPSDSAGKSQPKSLGNRATLTQQQQSADRSAARPIPVLDPPTVRSLAIMAASQGATVAIMGSGFEALELAAFCARVSSQSFGPAHRQQRNGQHGGEKKVVLLFGNSGPMPNFIPRYLSVAVTKRLRQFGVDVEDRALTRYISMDTPGSAIDGGMKLPRVELYTIKSYDHLDSKRILADLLVLAPSVDGLNGTAVIPGASTSSSSSGSSAASSSPRSSSNHQPWSSLISPPLLTCYLDDGRIATDSEFHAASSLYAAGSVAKYPDARTGRAEVAGGRHVNAEHAGAMAATNMVGDSSITHTRDQRGKGVYTSSSPPCYMQESIPVWRSDMIPYLPATDGNAVGKQQSKMLSASTTLALYSMGIHALCVGKCDSEGMATQGFWWTNTSRSNTSVQSDESKNGNNGNGEEIGNNIDKNGSSRKSIGPNAFMRRATRRTTNLSNNSKANGSIARGSLPVYGSGVVFYLDRSGNIEGVMLWGLPYSNDPKNVQSELNEDLVERMKDVIRSNGSVAIQDHSEKILNENSGANIDVGLLSHLHLVEESKHLALLALAGAHSELSPTEESISQTNRVSFLGRPLHRYTPIKPVELTNLGKMRRKDELGHLTEEGDLFYSKKAPNNTNEESGRPPSLKRIYPMQGGMGLTGTAEYHKLEKEMYQRQLQMERSRPPKEEPLWLRQGDEQRFVNRREALADSFQRNIQSGRFEDGSDAVKQAPVPRVYVDAKEKWNSWTRSDNSDES